MLHASLNRVSITERSGNKIVGATLEIIETYLNRLNGLVPATASISLTEVEDDSQDYGADIFDEGSPRLEYIGVSVSGYSYLAVANATQELDGKVKLALRDVLKRCFRSLLPINKDFVSKVTRTWSLLAATLISTGLRVSLVSLVSIQSFG